MRFEQHLRTFLAILKAYGADMPLAVFLKTYFRQNKQMGSQDRRVSSGLLYNYFRLGKACAKLPAEERLFVSQFLCSTTDNPFLNHFRPEWNSQIEIPLFEKIEFLEKMELGFRLADVFPFSQHSSPAIDQDAFLRSLFVQPDLFIRLNPAKAAVVLATLNAENIWYQQEGGNTLRLANGTKLDQLFADDALALYEVQDLSSQQTGNAYQPNKWDAWWDACAGSGGKSLLLFQQQPDIKLLVSDMRETILDNLTERFNKNGLRKFQKKQLDLTQNPDPDLHHYAFDGIILDIPCSGSGTWGRTPEMISQFHESSILHFQKLQQTIASNVVKYLKPGKPLIYITCSVFKEENEDMVEFLCEKFGLKVESQQVLKGYENKADTMFVARLSPPAP
jgi:16S rRNA (cytosine967-C5)-methyltransferase